jgi:hypothetical protein
MLTVDQISQRLGNVSLAQAAEELGKFDSYSRSVALVFVMARASGADRLRAFLEWGNVCDAPWANRSLIAGMLRQIPMAADLLPPAARTFYEALPDPVPIWRGCDRGRERGLHWTTRRAVAEGFATGKRCFNAHPTLASAEIPKRHVFAVFVCRDEDEVVVDPRRLRKLKSEPLLAVPR